MIGDSPAIQVMFVINNSISHQDSRDSIRYYLKVHAC